MNGLFEIDSASLVMIVLSSAFLLVTLIGRHRLKKCSWTTTSRVSMASLLMGAVIGCWSAGAQSVMLGLVAAELLVVSVVWNAGWPRSHGK